jgi:hypothetical protein
MEQIKRSRSDIIHDDDDQSKRPKLSSKKHILLFCFYNDYISFVFPGTTVKNNWLIFLCFFKYLSFVFQFYTRIYQYF